MVQIKGIQKTSLVDYDSYTSCVVFLSNCNFRCGFCHNLDLVLNYDKIETISHDDFFSFLDSRKKWLDAVVISGGEPTLHKNLVNFISKIKDKDFLVKLDTNGTNPILIKELLSLNLVDYIAMDIKSSIDNYEEVAGCKVSINNILESINLIKSSSIDYEFRTTVVPGYISLDEIKKIGKMLSGSKKYVIQNMKTKNDMIDSSFKKLEPYSKSKLDEMKDSVKNCFEKIVVKD
jgi:pyruvate formate lyase activating enzyme